MKFIPSSKVYCRYTGYYKYTRTTQSRILIIIFLTLFHHLCGSQEGDLVKNVKNAELHHGKAKRLRIMYDNLIKMQDSNEEFYLQNFLQLKGEIENLNKILDENIQDNQNQNQDQIKGIIEAFEGLNLRELFTTDQKFIEIIGKFQDRELEIVNTNYRDYKEFHRFFESLIPKSDSDDLENLEISPEPPENETQVDLGENVVELIEESNTIFEDLHDDQEKISERFAPFLKGNAEFKKGLKSLTDKLQMFLMNKLGWLMKNKYEIDPNLSEKIIRLQDKLKILIRYQKGEILLHDEL